MIWNYVLAFNLGWLGGVVCYRLGLHFGMRGY